MNSRIKTKPTIASLLYDAKKKRKTQKKRTKQKSLLMIFSSVLTVSIAFKITWGHASHNMYIVVIKPIKLVPYKNLAIRIVAKTIRETKKPSEFVRLMILYQNVEI